MDLELVKLPGTAAGGNVAVSDAVFGAPFNEPLVHQVVTAWLAGQRAGTRATKSRAEVAGGGRKPWRQKGMGRARAGSIRSPLWRGGGMTFAARPRDYTQKVNRKMYRAALRSVLSELVRQQRLQVVSDVAPGEPKTRALLELVGPFAARRVLLLVDELGENLYLAARNVPWLDVCDVTAVDPVSLVAAERVLATPAALKALEERLA